MSSLKLETMTKKFTFKPLIYSDLDLLCSWFGKPHVLEWWYDQLSPQQIKEKYGERIGDNTVCPYIAYFVDKPIAFIQYYWASNEAIGTVGLDQFIGEENYIHKGYGTLLVREFIQYLFQNPLVKKIIIEVNPHNLCAKRCYEKVGFCEIGLIDTSGGKFILMALYKNDETLLIDDKLVRKLVNTQFPQWQYLPICSVTHPGWDNRTFHLGDMMLVRLPSRACYAAQVEKEQYWLPKLAPSLPLSIPLPLGIGTPAEIYPWSWSIYRYLPGEPLASAPPHNIKDLAADLAHFLSTLQEIDTSGGPQAGLHSFYRGSGLAIYNDETRQAIIHLKGKIDRFILEEIWDKALASSWHQPPTWIHGDISAGNLLIQNAKLSGVIDFGQLAVGDPACDLAIAWTFLKEKSREVFRTTLAPDDETWARGRGWALWKALMNATLLTPPNNYEAKACWDIIREIIADYKKNPF